MADKATNGDICRNSEDLQQEKAQKRTAKYDCGAADLERVTDYAEEKEVVSGDFSGVRKIFIMFF